MLLFCSFYITVIKSPCFDSSFAAMNKEPDMINAPTPETGHTFAREFAALGSLFASGYLILLVL